MGFMYPLQHEHIKPKQPQYAPNLWTVPAYGKQLQMVPSTDEIELVDKKSTKQIQSIIGTFLYYY